MTLPTANNMWEARHSILPLPLLTITTPYIKYQKGYMV